MPTVTTTDVTKFDPTSFVDKLRDKIKHAMIDVIPDEQWDTMLKHEVETFFRSKVVSDYHGNREQPSEFRRIVLGILEEEIKTRTKAMFAGPEWQSYWADNKQKAGEEIARLARENGAAILSKWLESAITQVIDSIRFQR